MPVEKDEAKKQMKDLRPVNFINDLNKRSTQIEEEKAARREKQASKSKVDSKLVDTKHASMPSGEAVSKMKAKLV